MNYYQQPSQLGLPILKILISNPDGECRHAIYQLEREAGWTFNLCSAIKYLWRLGDKSDKISSDLSKAIDYLNWELGNPISASQEHFRLITNAIVACENLRRYYLPSTTESPEDIIDLVAL